MDGREYQVELGIPYLHLKDDESAPRGDFVGVYVQRHLPTGNVSMHRIAVVGNLASLLRLLERWNGQQPGTWQYRLTVPRGVPETP